MAFHQLKTWPSYMRDIHNGKKTFEVRRADRDFREGDWLQLLAFDPKCGYVDLKDEGIGSMAAPPDQRKSCSVIVVLVTYILPPTHTPPGYVVMSITRNEAW